MSKKLKIAFDVDYTLIGENFEPLYDQIWLFQWFDKQGHDMIIWSGGGIEYARHWAERLGLKARIIEKCSEDVDIAIDDAKDFGTQFRGFNAKVVIIVGEAYPPVPEERLNISLGMIKLLENK